MAVETFGDNPLDMAVDRAEFLCGPGLYLSHGGGVEPQEKTFAGFLFSHAVSCIVCLC